MTESRMAKRLLKFAMIFSLPLMLVRPGSSQEHPTATLTVRTSGSTSANGAITIAFNGYSETVNYGQFSTPASIASAFAAEFSANPVSALPRLCTLGICAKADGANVIFQLESPGTFGSLTVTSPNNPFTIDQSAWPTGPTLQLGVTCSLSEIIVGTAISCAASMPVGTTGSVTFSVDGATWQTVAIDGNGNATTSSGLQNQPVGIHVVQAEYAPSGSASISGIAIVSVVPNSTNTPSAPPGPVYSFSITDVSGNAGYTPNGNIRAYTDSVNGIWGVNASGVGAPMGYDSLNRLVSATQTLPGGAAQFACWSYDSFGNMKQAYTSGQGFTSLGGQPCQQTQGAVVSETQMNYTDGSNRINNGGWRNSLGTFDQGSPVYNAAGNMTNDLQNQYLYNAEGNVCAMQSPGGYGLSGPMVGYLYNAAGQRVAKGTLTSMSCDPTSNGFEATNVYVLGPGGEQMTEMTSNPAGGAMQWKNTNVYGGSQLIATYDLTPSVKQALHFQLADWEGTRRVQTDYAGNIEETCTSGAFGDVLNCTQSGISTADDATEQHFTGKERDAESGLDYFGARYFGSAMGRFISPDWSAQAEPVPYAKLDNPQSLNLYAYVGNNPLVGIDADGHVTGGIDHSLYNIGCSGDTAEGCDNPDWNAIGSASVQRQRDQAQSQKSSSGGTGLFSRLFHGLGNLIHKHSWTYSRVSIKLKWRSAFLPDEPRDWVTNATDLIGVAAPYMGKFGNVLGVVGTGASLANDRSIENKVTNAVTFGVPLVAEGTAVPLAAAALEKDAVESETETFTRVFSPDATQNGVIDNGYGISISNPALMDGSEAAGAP